MFKDGIVYEIDAKTARVRVIFPDLDNMVSGWLPVVMPCTLEDRFYALPVKDSLVTCLMDENFEDGRVIGAIYSEADPPPVEDENKFVKLFADGTQIEYDKNLHKLTADIKGSADVIAENTVTLTCPTVNIASIVNIEGNVSMIGNVSITGPLETTDNITSGADVLAGGISLTGHTHPGDSGGATGAPQ
jgi:phage baseplate assembly protein V